MDKTCDNCGSTEPEIELVSPDMDIKPVALCRLCRVWLVVGNIDEFKARQVTDG